MGTSVTNDGLPRAATGTPVTSDDNQQRSSDSTRTNTDDDAIVSTPVSPVSPHTVALSHDIPLSSLPPLPARSPEYRTEPAIGISTIGVLIVLFVLVTHIYAFEGRLEHVTEKHEELLWLFVCGIYAEAGLAAVSISYLLFGRAGVIRRSHQTCYPIPGVVASRLKEGRSLVGLRNIPGSCDAKSIYCVRCLVWRPSSAVTTSHHCSICQRCVVGFDHHCGVFGRCIVSRNMPCFVSLFVLLCMAIVTSISAVAFSKTPNLALT